MRILHRHEYGLFQESFALGKSDNVREAHVWICINDLILDRDSQVSQIRVVAEVGQGLKDSVLKELLDLLILILSLRLLLYDSALDSEIIVQ